MLVLVYLIVFYFPFKIVSKMLKDVYYIGSGKYCNFIADFKIKKGPNKPHFKTFYLQLQYQSLSP